MPNNIDPYVYPDNNGLIVCRPTRTYIDGAGDEVTVELTGLTDLKAYYALTAEAATSAAAINAGLVLDLDEEGATSVYHGLMLGSAKRTHMSAILHDTLIYLHYQSVTGGYHEVAEVTYRTHRVADLV